ncbi:MAG: hypothetical protein K9M17_03415 [Mariprofundaceae bacterium]|nr:hypothetical protein [Mariprofundaceae bacterium]
MRKRVYLAVSAVLFLFPACAGAFEPGKINVGSHLGESFRAEVPLALDEGEAFSKISVELAAPADYRLLNVHRHPALSLIHSDLTGDNRGGRVELSSRDRINAPYMVIILKIRYGNATHFQKYPVFLDIARTARPLKKKMPPVTASASDLKGEPATRGADVDTDMDAEVTVETLPPFKPFDGWARTSRYGPVVYGDTIFTIADRLRIDKRYTIRQIMVALFEKNRTGFADENLNLAMYGTYLDVPTAEEVELLTYEQALAIIQDHDRRFRELKQQPGYAAIAEAQRTRYSKRARDAGAIQAGRESSVWVEGGDSE